MEILLTEQEKKLLERVRFHMTFLTKETNNGITYNRYRVSLHFMNRHYTYDFNYPYGKEPTKIHTYFLMLHESMSYIENKEDILGFATSLGLPYHTLDNKYQARKSYQIGRRTCYSLERLFGETFDELISLYHRMKSNMLKDSY